MEHERSDHRIKKSTPNNQQESPEGLLESNDVQLDPRTLNPFKVSNLQRTVGNTLAKKLVDSKKLPPSSFIDGFTKPKPAIIQRDSKDDENTEDAPTQQGTEAPKESATGGEASPPPAGDNGADGDSAPPSTGEANTGSEAGGTPESAEQGTQQAEGNAGNQANGAPPNVESNGATAGGDASGENGAGGASLGATTDNGGAGNVELHMPEPPQAMTPETQAGIEKSQQNAVMAAGAQAQMPGAAGKVSEARKEVTEPPEETQARSENTVVDTLGKKPKPSPEIEQLCDRIRQVIKSKRPPDEDALVEADPEAMAKDAGAEMNTAVEGDAERVQGEYNDLEETPQGEPQQQPTPAQAIPQAESTEPINAQNAVGEQVPAENVSLDEDVQSTQQQMDEAGMNTEPAQLVEDGPIAEAREAQGELEESAQQDPQQVMMAQQAAIAAANNDMAALEQQALAALAQSRERTVGGSEAHQDDMVTSEEGMRQRVAQQASQIYSQAQSQVRSLLQPLPQTAMEMWESGVASLSTEFKASLQRVEEWIEDRHSGLLGGVTEFVDNTFGYPSWVTEEYNAAEKKFGDGVCDLLREISTKVNGVIASAHAIIEQSRTDINSLYDSLPAELQDWATQQKAEYQGRLDGLSAEATETRDTLNRDLVQRASQAVQDVRQEVHALREKAKGLIGRIASAIGQFLKDPAKAIINGLLKLIGIAASAFWSVVNRIESAISSIAEDPINFANNLINALKTGFENFFNNVATHLKEGLFKWLFARLGDVGVEIPGDFSLNGIITFFLQVMGITWEKIKGMIAERIGEKNMALIEKAYGYISQLIELGPAGVFELIKEKLDPKAIFDIILQTAIDFMIETLIKQVAMRLIGMLNPAGAILQAIEAIYKVLSWLFEHAARLFELIETIVGGITDIIAGNIGGMAAAIERSLSNLLPIVIDFLADFLGLGDLPKKIAKAIKRIQKKVEGVLESVIDFIIDKAKAALKFMGVGGSDEENEAPEGSNAQNLAMAHAAISAKEKQYRHGDGSITAEEAQKIATQVKREKPEIQQVNVTEAGDAWSFDFTFVQRSTKSVGNNSVETKKNTGKSNIPEEDMARIRALVGQPVDTADIPEEYYTPAYRDDKIYQLRRRSDNENVENIDDLPFLSIDNDRNIMEGKAGRISSSSAMDLNLGSKEGYQRHHLIADNVAQTHALVIEARNRRVWTVDHRPNLIMLPSTDETAAQHTDLPKHSGSHSNWDNDIVKPKLDRILYELTTKRGKTLDDVTDAELKSVLRHVQSDLASTIRTLGGGRLT